MSRPRILIGLVGAAWVASGAALPAVTGCVAADAVAVDESGSRGNGGGAGAGDAGRVAQFELVVDAPANHAALDGLVTVRGRAPGFLNVEVWDATHKNPALAQTTPGKDGRFTTSIDTGKLTPGPTTWTVFAWDSPPGQPFTRTASVALDLTLGGGSGDASPTTGACAKRTGAPGHVAPTCMKEALFGGAYLDYARWAAKLGRASLDLQTQWDDVTKADPANDANADWGWINGHFSVDEWIVQGKWAGALSLGMPMWVRGQSPSVCASGENDAHMTQVISTLRDKVGDRAVYVRLGWEFNAAFYPTQTSEGDASYQEAWRACWVRWYDAIKSVSPQYMVVWNPNWANNGACQSGFTSVLGLWPGAEYVDAAGPDRYDANWCGRPATYDERDGEQPIGIGAWVRWVIGKGVPFAVPEWGVDSGEFGSGDRPEFIRDMYAAFREAQRSDSGLAYQSYFDGGSVYECRHSLLDDACSLNPNSSAEYFSLFATWPPE